MMYCFMGNRFRASAAAADQLRALFRILYVPTQRGDPVPEFIPALPLLRRPGRNPFAHERQHLGWRGDRILVTGKSFANTISAYDTFEPGPWIDTAGLSPFTIAPARRDVHFDARAGGAQRGAPRDCTA